MFGRITGLIQKELLIEYRESHSFWASLLYLTAIIYVVYRVMGDLSGLTWIAMFWIILLFTSINIIVSGNGGHIRRRALYHYSLYNPIEVLIAKTIYSWVKIIIAGCLLLGFLYVFSENSFSRWPIFIISLLLAGFGIATNLVFLSSVASYANGQSTLIAILSLPILIPVLLLAMKSSSVAGGMIFDSSVQQDLYWLAGIDLLTLGIALLLIPYLWKS